MQMQELFYHNHMTGNGCIELFKVTSYNFQLIGQKLVLWAPPAGGGDKVSQ